MEEVERVKAKHLTTKEKRRVWYCFIIATVSNRRRQGLASVVLQEMQSLAIADGNRCLWLEASSPEAKKTYEKQGFISVDELVFGAGMFDTTGRMKEGGEGVRCWPMVWRPSTTGKTVS